MHEHVSGLVILINREGTGKALAVGSEHNVFANVGGTNRIAVLVPTDGEVVQAVAGMADALPDSQTEAAGHWGTRGVHNLGVEPPGWLNFSLVAGWSPLPRAPPRNVN